MSFLRLICLFSVYSVVAANQVPFSGSSRGNLNGAKLITPELSEKIEGWMEELGVNGLTVGVVHLDADNEYGAWGVKTEDGEPATPEVRTKSFTLLEAHSH